MKKLLLFTLSFCVLFSVFTLPAYSENKPIPNLAGEWKQTNSTSTDSWQFAIISGKTITIYWISDKGETQSLYWDGSFDAPKTAAEPYVFKSKNNHSKTDSAFLATSDDTKTITYQNGILSYKVSILGITTTVKLKKQKTYNEVAKPSTPVKTVTIKTVKDLEKYLKDNFGTLKTSLVTFDLKNDIQIIENEDQNICFDIAIVVNWSAVDNDDYKIRNSIKYTDKQKEEFDNSLKTYQEKIANVAIKAFPTKKIRGGFLDYGYDYPAIKEDYYEGAPYGWKNYDYLTDILPIYNDTKISKFHWFTFGDLVAPLDTIGIY